MNNDKQPQEPGPRSGMQVTRSRAWAIPRRVLAVLAIPVMALAIAAIAASGAPTPPAFQPVSGSDWHTGWTVFVDVDRNRAFDESTDLTVLKQGALPSYFSASAQAGDGTATNYLMFDASGYSQSTSSAAFRSVTLSIQRTDLTDAALKDQTRLIVISVTGRVRVCKPATDTSCVAGATE